ncbi:MAG: hypothetical protein R2838_23445 [Caldilineaceae bacterium]
MARTASRAPFGMEDLEAIEKRMRQIIGGKFPFDYREVSADEARAIFADQPYKLDLIAGLEKGGVDEYGNEIAEKPVISKTYRQDTFEDLCCGLTWSTRARFRRMRSSHVGGRGILARRRAQPMLQRIYGTAWRNKKVAQGPPGDVGRGQEARDHRKLGRELEIFIFDEEKVGPGLLPGCPTAR